MNSIGGFAAAAVELQQAAEALSEMAAAAAAGGGGPLENGQQALPLSITERIAAACAQSSDYLKERALLSISKELVADGDFDRAIEVANMIDYSTSKARALSSISNQLAKVGDFDRAIEVANTISLWLYEKDQVLGSIAGLLGKEGMVDRALKVVNMVDKSYWKSVALCKIIKELTAKDDIAKVLEFVDTRPEELDNSLVLYEISKKFVVDGGIERGIEVANRIPDKKSQTEAFCAIASQLHIIGEGELARAFIKQALEVANGMPDVYDNYDKTSSLCAIAETLGEMGEIEWACAVANQVPVEQAWKSGEVLVEISRKLASDGEIDRALGIASSEISDDCYRKEALCLISSILAGRGEIDRALELVEEFSEGQDFFDTLLDIISKLMELRQFDRAQKVADMIDEEYFQDEARAKIDTKPKDGAD